MLEYRFTPKFLVSDQQRLYKLLKTKHISPHREKKNVNARTVKQKPPPQSSQNAASLLHVTHQSRQDRRNNFRLRSLWPPACYNGVSSRHALWDKNCLVRLNTNFGVRQKFCPVSSDFCVLRIILITARCTMHSAKRGLAIACRLSVCPSVTSVICDHILEILETNCTVN